MALTYGTLRAHLYTLLRLPVIVGSEVGLTNDTTAALLAGKPVTLTRAQLDMLGSHPSKDAVDLDLSDRWVLGVDDTLTPAP